MPVIALFRSSRVDQTQYDAIIQELDLESRPAAGILSHACGFDDKGLCVVDVWEFRTDFEIFLSDRLRPAFAKLNIEFSEPEIIEAYSFRVSDDVEQYKGERGATFGAAREGMSSAERPPGTPY